MRRYLHRTDAALKDIRAKDFAGVVVPCLAAGDMPDAMPDEAMRILREAEARGLMIAAQNSGVLLLGKAGLLRGRRYAVEESFRALYPEGSYSGIGVVRDGRIVTSGTCPFMAATTGKKDGTAEMMKLFIDGLAER